jgi:hypothetical protein
MTDTALQTWVRELLWSLDHDTKTSFVGSPATTSTRIEPPTG